MEIVAALAKSLLLPPFGLFLLIAAGWLIMRRHRRLGRVLFAAGLVTLYLLSTPYIGSLLLRSFQIYPALSADRASDGVGAIVVLGADVRRQAPEFGGDTVGALTLERIRYGAKLHRELGLPLLVTGGAARPQGHPVGLAMRESLEQDFVVPVRWAETEAVNTYENAKNSSDILTAMGIAKIYLVTHAWHMPRAKMAFESTGLQVVPAPTGFLARPTPEFGDFIATASGLLISYYALYEGVGYLWYSLNY
jgi:uncharacterized SAM-binding protein YcdF (DUF218 family)